MSTLPVVLDVQPGSVLLLSQLPMATKHTGKLAGLGQGRMLVLGGGLYTWPMACGFGLGALGQWTGPAQGHHLGLTEAGLQQGAWPPTHLGIFSESQIISGSPAPPFFWPGLVP